MSRRRNTNEFYTARKLIEQIDLFTFLKTEGNLSDRWELKILASRILTFIQNMSVEEFETLMRITVPLNLQNVIDEASDIIGGDSYTVESFKKAKEANETETVVPTRPVVPPRPIIQFENNTIILKPTKNNI